MSEFSDIAGLLAERDIPHVKVDSVKSALVVAVINSAKAREQIAHHTAELEQAKAAELLSRGSEHALWPMFLAGSDLTPDQALAQDYKDIRTACESQTNGR